MKKQITALLFIALTTIVFGQKNKVPQAKPFPVANPTISKNNLLKLELMQDTLHQLGMTFTADTSISERQKACYAFIPKMIAALKTENSFYFPFDSLDNLSRIYSPDSTFRIFTWQLVLPQGRFRYYGFIQTKSSKLKLFPLYDLSDTMQYHTQKPTTNQNWYGALYYNVIAKQTASKKQVYTVFGFEGADVITRRKLIETLTFDEAGTPQFGKEPLFYIKYPEDTARFRKGDTLTRFFIEYKYNASTVFNYNPDLDKIVFDHVTPPNPKATGATFSYVPDGTYEGFEWKNSRWNWIEKVFTFSIDEDDNPPIPVPLFGQPKTQPELPK